MTTEPHGPDGLLIVEDLALLLADDSSGTPAGAGRAALLAGRRPAGGARTAGTGRDGEGLVAHRCPGPRDGRRTAAGSSAAGGVRRDRREAPGRELRHPHPGRRTVGPTRGAPGGPRTAGAAEVEAPGHIPHDQSPATDDPYEPALRARVAAVLEDGEPADPRTAGLVALVSASGTLPLLHPRPKWSSAVHDRGKEFRRGTGAPRPRRRPSHRPRRLPLRPASPRPSRQRRTRQPDPPRSGELHAHLTHPLVVGDDCVPGADRDGASEGAGQQE